jgi:tetratricopeptide (TPR) repeat protein
LQDWDALLNAYEQALKIRQEADDVEEIEIILYRIAQAQYQLEQYEQSIATHQSAIEICEELGKECFIYSKDHSELFEFNTSIIDLHNGIGEVHLQQEQFELALESFQKAFLLNLKDLEL